MIMQLKDLQSKITHFNLNLDYPIESIPLDIQTNYLINKVINNFYNLYKDNIQQYNVVYEYRDDCISIVGLHLLQILAEQMNFNFEIFGKVKKFKKKVGKYRRINEKEVNKKSNVLLISNFNLIYKVNQVENLSKKINFTKRYNIVEQFTPDELSIAFNFYGGQIEEISKDDPVRSLETLRFNKWIKNPQSAALPQILASEKIKLPIQINVVHLSGKIEEDIKLLQEVEQSDDINFYYYLNTEIYNVLTDKNFAACVKHKGNIPNYRYMNINVDITNIKQYIIPNHIGDWVGGESDVKEDI